MCLKIVAIICFAAFVSFVYSDDDNLTTLNCYSCLSFNQEPTTANCTYMNCTDTVSTDDSPAQYAVCVKSKIQYGTQMENNIIYQASCELQFGLEDNKFCVDFETSIVPGMQALECESCRSDLCNSYDN